MRGGWVRSRIAGAALLHCSAKPWGGPGAALGRPWGGPGAALHKGGEGAGAARLRGPTHPFSLAPGKGQPRKGQRASPPPPHLGRNSPMGPHPWGGRARLTPSPSFVCVSMIHAEKQTVNTNKLPHPFSPTPSPRSYEWNKYNQTHYDGDNPPPKTVQGYKFVSRSRGALQQTMCTHALGWRGRGRCGGVAAVVVGLGGR